MIVYSKKADGDDGGGTPRVSAQSDDLVNLLAKRSDTMIVARGVFSLEYPRMFGFSNDLSELRGKRVLDIASGYSSFAAEASDLGIDVIAIDPLFAKFEGQISRKNLVDGICRLAQKELEDFKSRQSSLDRYTDSSWLVENPLHTIDSPAKIIDVRHKVLEIFMEDFIKHPERYIGAQLPGLQGVPGENHVVLIGNLLGSYCAQPWCNYEFHLSSLIRASELSKNGEVRMYPAATGAENLIGVPFDVPLLQPYSKGATTEEISLRTQTCLKDDLSKCGLSLELVPSNHKFVKGWTHTAIIRSA